MKEYDENLGESIDDMFNFSVDATKLTEKLMKPHIIPEIGLNNGADSKKKKIPMKKKEWIDWFNCVKKIMIKNIFIAIS